VRITGELRLYRFATETADFARCAVCGFFVGALCEANGPRAVINADLFVSLRHREGHDADFDGETVAERLARRAQTWTPVRRD
jgi:hypothetical protein